MGYIYVITLDDKPVYVGKTTKYYLSRWISHIKTALKGNKRPLYHAIIKYGLERMKCIPQLKCNDEDTLFEYEKFLINTLGTRIEQNGYNLTDGGEGISGHLHSSETRDKIRKSNIGKKHEISEGGRKRLRENGHKAHTEKSRSKTSQSLKGHKTTEETRQKQSKSNRGQQRSEETKNRLKEAWVRRKERQAEEELYEAQLAERIAKLEAKLKE